MTVDLTNLYANFRTTGHAYPMLMLILRFSLDAMFHIPFLVHIPYIYSFTLLRATFSF